MPSITTALVRTSRRARRALDAVVDRLLVLVLSLGRASPPDRSPRRRSVRGHVSLALLPVLVVLALAAVVVVGRASSTDSGEGELRDGVSERADDRLAPQAAAFAVDFLQYSLQLEQPDLAAYLSLRATPEARARIGDTLGTWRSRVLVGLGAPSPESALVHVRPLGYRELPPPRDRAATDRVDVLLWLELSGVHEGRGQNAYVHVRVGVRGTPTGLLVDSVSEATRAPGPDASSGVLFEPVAR